MKKLVIAPVYNEAETLSAVMARMKKCHDGDIVVVDDGSTDGSARILETIDGIKVIRHRNNLGYGQSLIDGFGYALDNRYELVVTIDCDEQHEPCMIPAMFRNIGDNDVLSGSRYLPMSEACGEPPKQRRNINMAITKIINKVTRFELTDSFCGFKCYKTSALARLYLDEPGYAMPLQFWVQAGHFGLKVAETPTPRIYKNMSREFGEGLDNPESRLEYYLRVIEKELCKWSICSSPELIRTI